MWRSPTAAPPAPCPTSDCRQWPARHRGQALKLLIQPRQAFVRGLLDLVELRNRRRHGSDVRPAGFVLQIGYAFGQAVLRPGDLEQVKEGGISHCQIPRASTPTPKP
ncbi:hypothetical protein G6F64_014888 [Rhizopus arrhizus]|uniref:Uncharacterized protein n=1 Tax=Rhizopus oryzae TaxID=64495 RepID=A0A9P6WT61_RHIOR|nr:hypothetical protein G6F64_014888 [Rhizopus arrhizus]